MSAKELASTGRLPTSRSPESLKHFLVTPIILLVAVVINTREHLSTDVVHNPPGSHTANLQPKGGNHLPAASPPLSSRAQPGRVCSSRRFRVAGEAELLQRASQACLTSSRNCMNTLRSTGGPLGARVLGCPGRLRAGGSFGDRHLTSERHLSHFHVTLSKDTNRPFDVWVPN